MRVLALAFLWVTSRSWTVLAGNTHFTFRSYEIPVELLWRKWNILKWLHLPSLFSSCLENVSCKLLGVKVCLKLVFFQNSLLL